MDNLPKLIFIIILVVLFICSLGWNALPAERRGGFGNGGFIAILVELGLLYYIFLNGGK